MKQFNPGQFAPDTTPAITLALPIASSWLRRTIARVAEDDRGRKQTTGDRQQAPETK